MDPQTKADFESIFHIPADELLGFSNKRLDRLIKHASHVKENAQCVVNWLKIIKYEKSVLENQSEEKNGGGHD